MERPERPLGKADFSSSEDWARFQHEGGLLRRSHRTKPYEPTPGSGPWAQLVNMTHDVRDGPVREYRRQSNGLEGGHYERLHEAVAAANMQSIVLNAHITIAWSTVGVIGDEKVGRAAKKFLELLRHWLSERGVQHAWIWVHERKETVGLHSHVLVHIPKRYQHGLKSWAASAFQSATGSLAITKKGGTSVFVRATHDTDWQTQEIWFEYLLKGLSQGEVLRDARDKHATHDIAENAGITPRSQGMMSAKRCGFARAVGPKMVEQLKVQYPEFARELAFVEPIGDRFIHLGQIVDVVRHLDI